MDKLMRTDWYFVTMCVYCVMMTVITAVPHGASNWEQLLVGLFVWCVAWLVLNTALPRNLPTLDKLAIVVAFCAVQITTIFIV